MRRRFAALALVLGLAALSLSAQPASNSSGNWALHNLDLHQSLFVGDKYRDIEPAVQYHASGFLIQSPETPAEDVALATAAGAPIVGSLLDAAKQFLERAP